MKLDLNQLANIHPKDIWLDISEEEIQRAWEESGNYSNDAARWNAYLNLLSLNPLVEWLKTETENSPQVWPSTFELPYIWDAVPGSAININNLRFVIIPSEQIDAAELRVPQEWIDIPSWAGEYYLALQVNLDDGWLRLWGLKRLNYFFDLDPAKERQNIGNHRVSFRQTATVFNEPNQLSALEFGQFERSLIFIARQERVKTLAFTGSLLTRSFASPVDLN